MVGKALSSEARSCWPVWQLPVGDGAQDVCTLCYRVCPFELDLNCELELDSSESLNPLYEFLLDMFAHTL